MDVLAALAKSILIPGSIGFLLVGATIGALLLLAGQRRRAWAARWLTGLVLLYWILSLPAVAGALVRLISSGFTPLESAEQADGAEIVVLLGGGAATLRAGDEQLSLLSVEAGMRVLEAARVVKLIEARWVFASGGASAEAGVLTPESEILREALIEAGVLSERIVLESDSHDTHEQAVALAASLSGYGTDTFVLVTSPDHMRRAMLSFRETGLNPIPSPALLRSEALPAPASAWLPTFRSLEESAGVFRELIGLGYYALRGWV